MMTYKVSKYNYFFKAQDGTSLAFNATTSGLAKLAPDKAVIVEGILKDPNGYNYNTPEKKEIKEKLLQGRFLVDEKEDEVNRLKVNNRIGRFSTQSLGLTIAPTLACNFRCQYCYETAKPGVMKPAVEKALVKMVQERMEHCRNLSVTWFGGEPLLALKSIGRLSARFKAICKKSKAGYSADIISNGYLWNRKTAMQLKRWGVKSVQITLDGPRDIHDHRRPLAGGKGSFDRILDNITKTYDVIPIRVRVNTDKTNALRVLELLDEISVRGLRDKIKIYFAQVETYTDVCKNISGSCYSSQEYSSLEVELYQKSLAKGFSMGRYPIPIGGGYCGADQLSSLVVAPSGMLFKCWNEIAGDENSAVGSILEKKPTGGQQANLENWLSWDAFEKKDCRSCNILPICMGGCPYNAKRLNNNDSTGHCANWKYHLLDMLKLTYFGHAKGLENKTP